MTDSSSFNFEVANGIDLVVRPEDTAILHEVAQITTLGESESCEFVKDCIDSVINKAGGRGAGTHYRITKAQFLACIEEIVPGLKQHGQGQYARRVEIFLMNLFYSYNPDSHHSVSTNELLTGLAFLSGGSKTPKLAFAFSLFDDKGADAIEQISLARLLNALLCALFACTTSASPRKDVLEAINQCAIQTTLSIFTQSDLADHELIDFDTFGAWYNEHGYISIPWVELLDLSKWPVGDDETGVGTSAASEPMISFDFPPPQPVKVTIAEQDVESLADLLEVTGFHQRTAHDVTRSLYRHATDGSMSKAGFDACLRQLIPRETLRNAASDPTTLEAFSQLLSSFFFAFERFDGKGVDVSELAAGFSLLCAGNKSEKLAHAWELISSDRSGGPITRRGLWRFLRSFLRMLMAVSSAVKELTPTELSAAADSGAVWTAAKVFEEANRHVDDTISFDEFAEWYTAGGYKVASWFELLDLSKWVLTSDREDRADSVATVPEAAVHPAADLPAKKSLVLDRDELEEQISTAFSFRLTEDGDTLLITRDDVEFVLRVASLSSSSSLTCDDLYAAVVGNSISAPGSSDGLMCIDKAGYDRAIRLLLPHISNQTEDEDLKFLAFAFMNIFFALEADDIPGHAYSHELVCGLSLLFSGSKSVKLQFSFALFDTDSDDKLSRAQLRSFLASIMAVLLACAFDTARISTRDAKRLVDRAVTPLVDSIVSEVGEANGLVSFEDFGNWYNNNGYSVAPWLELLDLQKWEVGSWAAVTESKADHSNATRFRFSLFDTNGDTSPFSLVLSDADIASVQNLVTKTGLCTMAPNNVCQHFLEAYYDGPHDKRSFDRCVRALIPSSRLASDDRNMLTVLLSSIYYSFEVSEESPASDALELCIGMTVLCSGDKSSKLRIAWHALDDDVDGRLTSKQIVVLMRSFLRMLMALSIAASRLEPEQTRDYASEMAAWLSASITEGKEEFSDTVSFDDFAEWYLQGHQVAPWLELLDLSKWALRQ